MSTPRIYPLARNTDPATSHIAAQRAEGFVKTHKRRILDAISKAGPLGITAGEVGALTGLTVVQIDRRITELHRDGTIELVGARFCNQTHSHMRAWRKVAA